MNNYSVFFTIVANFNIKIVGTYDQYNFQQKKDFLFDLNMEKIRGNVSEDDWLDLSKYSHTV
jgi:hypothetical protein